MKARKRAPNKQPKEPDVLYKRGRPTAVLLSIEEYRRLLESAEDQQDLRRLEALEKQPGQYRPLEEFLEDWKDR